MSNVLVRKKASKLQILKLLARLFRDVDWRKVDREVLEKNALAIPMEDFSGRFTPFLANGCSFVIGDPRFIHAEQFDPVSFLGRGWTIWRGPSAGNGLEGEQEIDRRSLVIASVETATQSLIFESCLNEKETDITGEEKLARLKARGNLLRLGDNIFLGFWNDYQKLKSGSALEYLYETRDIKCIDFFGTILRTPGGERSVLRLDRNDEGEWSWKFGYLCNFWRHDEVAIAHLI